MKKSIRLVSTALAPTLVAASLIACNTADAPIADTDPVTTSVTESVTEPTTEAETQPEDPAPANMELTAAVTIYCPTNRNRDLKKISTALVEGIKTKTGITLTVAYGGDDEEPADSEIILGHDDTRDATVTAYNATPVGGYGVHTEGATAVLTAWTVDDLQAAADLFLETCLVQEGDRWFVLPRAVAPDETEPAAVALSAYRIVYSADADDSIVKALVPGLQQYLLNVYGAHVAAVSDSEAPTEYELVIGNTNRNTDEIMPYLEGDNALQPNQSAIVPAENKFFILGDSAGTIALGVSRIMDTLDTHLIGQNTVWHTLAPVSLAAGGDTYVSAPMVTEDNAELAQGADLRIMSYNILNQEYVPDNPLPPERDEQFAEVLLYYMPDVVGIQEANLAWHESFDIVLGIGGAYLPACRYHDGTNTAQTTFLYNPLTVKLVDEYVIHYTDWEDSDIRVVSLAVFERLADGQRFVMTNTHPAPRNQPYYSGHIDEIIRIMTEEFAKYADLPIIMTGDFNTNENRPEYQKIMDSLNMTDARYDEGVELVHNACTYTSLPSGEAIGGTIYESSTGNIDHIFINDKLDSLLFNVVVDHNVVNISDHLPIYADLDLK